MQLLCLALYSKMRGEKFILLLLGDTRFLQFTKKLTMEQFIKVFSICEIAFRSDISVIIRLVFYFHTKNLLLITQILAWKSQNNLKTA